MKNKKIIAVICFFTLGIIWYLFIKPNDYLVTFKAKSSPSIVVNAIDKWGEELEANNGIKVITEKDSLFSEITQHIIKKDSSYVLIWNIKKVNDSLTDVKVKVSEKSHSLKNRLLIPFINAPIEKFAINSLTEFNVGFKKYLKTFTIKYNGNDNVPPAFCACKTENSLQINKAAKMLQMNLDIMSFFRKNNLDINGRPYLQVTSWDKENEKITFDFCFPIVKNDSIPLPENGIFYKKIKSMPAIKATYHGNYRYSDRTWNYLLNYSKNKNIKVQQLPTELFFNDPQQGGDELAWKAEIYMPIVK